MSIVSLEKSGKMETCYLLMFLNEINLDFLFLAYRTKREQICPVYKPLNVWQFVRAVMGHHVAALVSSISLSG